MVNNVATGNTGDLTPGVVFIFISLGPNVDILRRAIDLDQWGFIKTGATLETGMERVYTAGDVWAGRTEQVAIAAGEGAAATLMNRQFLEKTAGSRGYKGDWTLLSALWARSWNPASTRIMIR